MERLSDEEVRDNCLPGRGADTCIWLVMASDGFECLFSTRGAGGVNLNGETLEERWKAGLTVAKRDGCDWAREGFVRE